MIAHLGVHTRGNQAAAAAARAAQSHSWGPTATPGHTVRVPNAPFVSASGKLEVHQIPVWEDNLVWLVKDTTCQVDGQWPAVAVDGPEAGPVMAYCEANNIKLVGIINTHTHGDHIGINTKLQERGLLHSMRVVGNAAAGPAVPGMTEPVRDGDTVRLGEVSGTAILTEGHMDHHTAYLFDNIAFTGDSLFAGGCGYLFDGPPAKMHRGLTRLAALPPSTIICCAHEYTQDNLRFAWSVEPDNPQLAQRIQQVGALRDQGRSSVPSTLAEELATNPFLRPHSQTLRARVMQDGDAGVLSDEEVFARLRKLKDQGHHK